MNYNGVLKLKRITELSLRRFLNGKRRKYPVDPEYVDQLPVFQYNTSKKSYRRVFGWGNIHTGALGIPYFSRNESVQVKRFIRIPKRVTFGEEHDVVTAGCGFGFTIFAVDSVDENKVYGTGINTDSQIGYHDVRKNRPLEILYYPKPIHLPFKDDKSKIIKVSAGRAHALVLSEEALFTFGNNAYGQCGRKVIPNEDYIMSNYIHRFDSIDGKKIVDIECGQDHSIAVTEDGAAYACGWGADGQTGLGHYDCTSTFSRVKGDVESEKITKVACRADFVMALSEKGDVFGWGNTEYGQLTLPDGNQQVCYSQHIKSLEMVGKVASIACGGSLCIALNEHGQVFSWGYGLLGAGPAVQQSREPVHIPEILFGKNNYQQQNTVTNITCGLYHSAALTNNGDLYIWGRNKNGCLGLGNDKDQYFPLKVSASGFVTKVFCGVDHTIAICKPFI